MASVQFNDYSPSPRNIAKNYTITISIFFDGTKNNKNNTDARRKNLKSFRDHGSDEESSYQNDWSNVARLWENSKTEHILYVEGIGTTDGQGDSTRGFAYGSGETGIRFKVRKGCESAADVIAKVMDSNTKDVLKEIIFNVYGFSRGAAAARNFVYEIGKAAYSARKYDAEGTALYFDSDNIIGQEKMPEGGHLGYSLISKGITLNTAIVKVNFLGIFDTVSSYSKTVLPTFSNDISELNLNSLGKAQHVFHLTARDEIREYFSLTRSPKGLERDLPGVHSDVGGSYLSGPEIRSKIETAAVYRSSLETIQEKLIKDGWYKPGELTITNYWTFALRGEKAMVHKEYSFIPLHFMSDNSNENQAEIDAANLKAKYSLSGHPILQSAKGKLEKYVKEGAPYPYEGRALTAANLQELKDLRYGYFHRSARREGMGMDPNNDWKRRELE